jgi:hypothetical protein
MTYKTIVDDAIFLLFTAALGVAILALAGTRDDSVPDEKYVEYAQGFADYTVKVIAVGADGKPSTGTATLLSDHWAITSAHIVHDAKMASIDGHPSVEIVVHPKFEHDCMGCFDVALVRVEKPFGRAGYPPLSTGDEIVGDLCSVAGYGVHGPMSTGYDSADGRLRAGTARIDRFDQTRIICPISQDGSGPLPYGISPGDSGGPLFCKGRLCGVNSFTMADKGKTLKSKEGEEQGFARVSVLREWIDEVVR